VDETGQGKNRYQIKFTVKPGGRTLVLSAQSKAEMTDWWTDIDQAIQNKQKTFSTPQKKPETSLPMSASFPPPSSPSSQSPSQSPSHSHSPQQSQIKPNGCLREGFLKKKGALTSKDTYTVLTEKQLAFYDLNMKNKDTWSKVQAKEIVIINSNSEVSYEETGTGVKAKYILKIVSKPGDKAFTVLAQNKTDMLDWCVAIDQLIKEKKNPGAKKKIEEPKKERRRCKNRRN